MTRDQQIRAAYETGESTQAIGRRYGLTRARVSAIALEQGADRRFNKAHVDPREAPRALLRAMLSTGQHELDSLAIARIRGAAIGMALDEVRRSVVVA